MTEKELRKLGRGDLLEMLLEQCRENEKLREHLEIANEKLARRELAIDHAGSIAEASLKLSGIFEAAQNACAQYTENIKLLSDRQETICTQIENETRERCENQERETAEKCARLEHETTEKCEKLESETVARCENLASKTIAKCEKLERDTTAKCQQQEAEINAKCQQMLAEAKQQSEGYWNEVSTNIQEFTKSYSALQRLWEDSPISKKE